MKMSVLTKTYLLNENMGLLYNNPACAQVYDVTAYKITMFSSRLLVSVLPIMHHWKLEHEIDMTCRWLKHRDHHDVLRLQHHFHAEVKYASCNFFN